ncbi:MAG: RimK family alpha-L-glutamate ligase, partial [Halobacteriaceae archaeon]
EKSGGADIRAIVVGDEVVAAMKRTAEGNDVRANLHGGGEGEKIDLGTHARNLAVKVSKAIGAEIAGVDLLESHKGPMIIEANASPGLQGITKVSGVDVADKIAQYLYQRTREIRDREKERMQDEILNEIDRSEDVPQSFITDLDFRGARILLPEIVTDVTDFTDTDEFEIDMEEGCVTIEKYDI